MVKWATTVRQATILQLWASTYRLELDRVLLDGNLTMY